jgi:hypothetical protein
MDPITRPTVHSGDAIRQYRETGPPYPALADARSADSVRPSIGRGVFASRLVVEISGNDTPEMAFVHYDQMIEAIAAQGSDEPLHERVLPRTSRCTEDLFDPHALDPPLKCAAVDRIAIAEEVFRHAVPWEGFDDLLARPLSRRILGNVEVLLLGREAAADLRSAFCRGDVVRCREGQIRSRGAFVDLRSARTWRVPDPRPALAVSDTMSRLELARTRLAQVRRTQSSVLNGSGDAAIARLERACRYLDAAAALEHATRFIGWGEGLTPAGDDYLVGFCAALGTLACGDAGRHAFVDRMREFLATQESRTTPIAAHYLNLAALGHFNADILRAVDALRSEADAQAAQRTLDEIMATGATSGADALTGILSGFAAWFCASVMECRR